MAKRRAGLGGGRQHGRDARQNLYVEFTPGFRSLLQGLEDRRGHGEDARIAGGNDHDFFALGGERQRLAGALQLDPVVAGVLGEARPVGHPLHVGYVADDIARRGQRRLDLGRHQLLCARPETRDNQAPAHRSSPPGRRPWPCTRTMEK